MEESLGQPELIAVFPGGARIHPGPDGRLGSPTTNLRHVHEILEEYGASITVLFCPDEEKLARSRSQEAQERPWEFATFCQVNAPSSEKFQEIADKLAALDIVDGAYVKPPVQPAVREMPPAKTANPSHTPDFTSRQGYLQDPPAGIGQFDQLKLRSLQGFDVAVADCGWGWRVSHEDLQTLGILTFAGNNPTNQHHGTAVAGVIGGTQNPFGVTGIAPRISFYGYSWANGKDSRTTIINQAAAKLQPGDILVLEGHRPGPRSKFPDDGSQFGYIPLEWWPDDFAAIANATGRGVIVVEPAGNGYQDLNDSIYDVPLGTFPSWWRSPFNPKGFDSLAIVVGAGAPPPGTHEHDHGPDRSRLAFSNYGARLDVQGWGEEVTTTGYGDLQGGDNPDFFYTDSFAGTSSATPIVAGALACVQAVVKRFEGPPLTPNVARDLLIATGSPQQDSHIGPKSQRIGNRPDLSQMIDFLITEGLINPDHLPK